MRILWAIYPSAFVIYCGFSTKPVFWYSRSIIKWGWWSASSSEVDLRELQRLGLRVDCEANSWDLGINHPGVAQQKRVVTPWISLDFTTKQTVFIILYLASVKKRKKQKTKRASNSDGSWCNNFHRLYLTDGFLLTCKTWNITVSSVNNSFIINVVGFYQVVFFNRIIVEFLGRRW